MNFSQLLSALDPNAFSEDICSNVLFFILLLTPLYFVPMVFFGGVGALCRYIISYIINRIYHTKFPLATLIVNITACFIVGVVSAKFGPASGAFEFGTSKTFGWLLSIGFCGGFSTFSTVTLEVVKMLQKRDNNKRAYKTATKLVKSENCERKKQSFFKKYAILIYIGLQMILPAMMTVLGYCLA